MSTTLTRKRDKVSALMVPLQPSVVSTPAVNSAQSVEPELRERLLTGVVIGTVIGIDNAGAPLVVFAGSVRDGLAARSLVAIASAMVGREVVLMFEGGHTDKPIVMGVLETPSPVESARSVEVVSERETASTPKAVLDGERLTFSAEREIVLQCGKASLTLTRAGKVLITGEYVLTRARGVNRIRGGSVQIN